jgi:hypothetical protein
MGIDNERKAYRPKDGFDYVSFAVPEISVVLNQQHNQQKSATNNEKATNSSNPTPKQIKKISPDLRTRMQQKLGARDSPTDTTKHRTSELLAHTNLVINRRNNLLSAAKKAGDKGLCKALGAAIPITKKAKRTNKDELAIAMVKIYVVLYELLQVEKFILDRSLSSDLEVFLNILERTMHQCRGDILRDNPINFCLVPSHLATYLQIY